MVRLGSLALIGGLPRDGVPIKNWLLWHLVNINLNMSEVSDKKSLNNDVKEAGTEGEGFLPGKCPMGKQRGPGHHSAIARSK